jgi:endonuclease VIII
MPEGDTIFRTARTLQTALAGRTVTRFETVLPHLARVDDQTPLRGRTVERVEAAGKHLLIVFSGGLTLRTHMRMSGSWHIYRPGERWRKARADMRIVIATDEYVAVGFNIPDAEFAARTEFDPSIDILSEAFDCDAAIQRIRQQTGDIGDVLLKQRVVAGIGNIYKSESLFMAGIDPFTPIAALTDEQIGRILNAARKLMLASTRGTRGRLSVYSRGGQPCRRCGTPIAYRRSKTDARGTYWCPKCQRSGQ